jgi:predicted unusual protein kinase regulating ubiquinone biosynthesis (AarF/ABC1/UbiB family)
LERVRGLGVEPADVAQILLNAFSEMLLRHGIFHADPHPGNLVVLPGPKLGLLDFGQVKDIGPEFRDVFVQFTRALVLADDGAIGRSFRDLGFRMKLDTAEGYEQLGNAYLGNIARRMSSAGAAWAEGDMFRDSYQDIARILRSNPVTAIPSELLFVGRVMGLLSGIGKQLGVAVDLASTLMPYLTGARSSA